MLDPLAIRKDFPIYKSFSDKNKPFIYLDNAATTHKPAAVINSEAEFYGNSNANVHRSPHSIGMEATDLFEKGRNSVASFLGLSDPCELVLTKGTTEAINLIAGILASQYLQKDDVILVTPSEHHSNLLPWQFAAARTGAKLEFVELHGEGFIDLDEVRRNWNPKTKVFSFQHASNVTGIIHDVEELTRIGKQNGAIVIVDGAQSAPHMKIDVKKIDCDFYAVSGHKLVGPTGIGALYGRKELLNKFDPIFGGGEMIVKVTRYNAIYNVIPYKFEPGTPNIAGAVGFGAAVEYLMGLGMNAVEEYLDDLSLYACQRLRAIEGLRIFGRDKGRTGAVSFLIDGCHPHDIASILDTEGIAIRAGGHCAEPLMDWFCVPATARASFYIYNTKEEVDKLVDAIEMTKKVLGYGS